MLIYWTLFAFFALAALGHRDPVPQSTGARGHDSGDAGPAGDSIAPQITAVILIVFIGFRYHVGGDWNNYDIAFQSAAQRSLKDVLATSPNEYGYAFLNWLAWQFEARIWFVNLICAVPFCWGLMRLCQQQPNPWLAFLVATPFLIIVVGMGFTRQAAALGFMLIGLSSFIRTRSLTAFVFYCLFGALFHRTVLIFIPIMIIATGQTKLTTFLLAILTAVIGYATIFRATIQQYGAGYINADYDAAGATVRVLMNILPALILLMSKNRFYRSREEKVVWKTFATLALVAGAALPVISSSVIIDRLSMYIIPIQLFVLSRIPYLLSGDNRKDVGWVTIIAVYSAAVLFVWLTYGHYASGWLPYRSFLTTPGSFSEYPS